MKIDFSSPFRAGETEVESGEWRVESGEWRVESGQWKVESGKLKVESGENIERSPMWENKSFFSL